MALCWRDMEHSVVNLQRSPRVWDSKLDKSIFSTAGFLQLPSLLNCYVCDGERDSLVICLGQLIASQTIRLTDQVCKLSLQINTVQ